MASNCDLMLTPRIQTGTFIRYDNEGVSLIFPAGIAEPLLVNRTVTDILKLVAEELTITQIAECLSKKYKHVDSSRVLNDVLKTLNYLAERRILSFN
jgi:hypothetical protein